MTLQEVVIKRENWQEFSVFIRPESKSDRLLLTHIFTKNDYAFSYMKQFHAFEAYAETLETPYIIDAGANIGLSVQYFHRLFPKAHIVAIEPDKDNCTLLKLNTKNLDTDIRQNGLSNIAGTKKLYCPIENGETLGDWSFRTHDGAGTPVEMISTKSLIEEKSETHQLLLFKMDIEGGEKEVFSSNIEWLQDCPLLIIEIHDWTLAGEAPSKPFFQAISQYNFDVVLKGENLFCFNNDILFA